VKRGVDLAVVALVESLARSHPETRDHIARRHSEGKTTRDAIRRLKRYLARRAWRLLQPPTPSTNLRG
jgi:transposase